jgi:hypothetical protein
MSITKVSTGREFIPLLSLLLARNCEKPWHAEKRIATL